MKKYSYFAAIIMAAISSCKPEFDEFKPSAGNANFSKYIALGNSLTAGYADQALYRSGQENSYPNLMAMQFKQVGGGEFKQPLVNDELGIGFSNENLTSKLTLQLKADCKGVSSLSPAFAGQANAGNLAPIGNQGPFNNMGVPGAKSFHLITPGYGSVAGNPFFARFATSTTTTVLADAAKQEATFFSLWIGNNDILTYGIAGGESDSITSPSSFEFYLNSILQTMTANGSKGVIATIPDVTIIPFFNTIPYNALILTDQNQVNLLNTAYGALGIKFNLGQNALIIEDTQAPGGLRQIKSTEKLLLTTPQDSIKCFGWGSQKPIPDEFVLDETEISALISAADNYNGIIRNMADKYNLALADVNQQIGLLNSGLSFDAVNVNATFVSGGVFSLDGIHLTPRGNAIVANIFLSAINDKYKAKIPLVDVTRYRGVAFP
jgi:lysophospholipase L1-like esterase